MGLGAFFPTNLDLANILDDTDCSAWPPHIVPTKTMCLLCLFSLFSMLSVVVLFVVVVYCCFFNYHMLLYVCADFVLPTAKM